MVWSRKFGRVFTGLVSISAEYIIGFWWLLPVFKMAEI
jgi:hypothetical protein